MAKLEKPKRKNHRPAFLLCFISDFKIFKNLHQHNDYLIDVCMFPDKKIQFKNLVIL
jgi:hypothetical protein